VDIIKKCFGEFLNKTDHNRLESIRTENNTTFCVTISSQIIVNLFVNQLLDESRKKLNCIIRDFDIKGVNANKEFHALKEKISVENVKELISYSSAFSKRDIKFKKFLKSRIISSYVAQKMDGKADYLIRQLFKCFLANPQQLPDNTILRIYRNLGQKRKFINDDEPFIKNVGLARDQLKTDHLKRTNKKFHAALLRTIADYIAGMTDQYALKIFHELYESGFSF
jgi:dGTPase